MATFARLFFMVNLVVVSVFVCAGCNLLEDDNDPMSYCTEVLEGNSDFFDITPGTIWEYAYNQSTTGATGPGDTRKVASLRWQVVGPGKCIDGAQEIVVHESLIGVKEFFSNTNEQRDLGWQFSGSIHFESTIRFIVSDSLQINGGNIGAILADKSRLPWTVENTATDSVVVSHRDFYTGTRVTLEKGKGMVNLVRVVMNNRTRDSLELTLVEDEE